MPLRPRLTRAAAAMAALAVALAVAGCAGNQANAPGTGNGVNTIVGGSGLAVFAADDRKPAPVVSGSTVSGSTVSTAAWRGQVVVMNFWASWCAPCRAEAPFLADVARQTRGQGVQFLGVDVKDRRASAAAFLSAKGVPYPSLYDQPGTVGLLFNDSVPVASIPTTYVIDRQGRIAARDYGGLTSAQLLPVVRSVLAESA